MILTVVAVCVFLPDDIVIQVLFQVLFQLSYFK